MGIVSGSMSVARYRVVGEVREGWRDRFRDGLDEHAFRDPPQGMGKEEVEGWVQVHNLLDTSFADFNRWLYNGVAVFALRVDKKRLPARLFKATLEKRIQAWCRDKGVERCPNAVKTELKENLEQEWLARALPSTAVTECAWHVHPENHAEGYVLVHALSDTIGDRIRKRFFRTFGLKLVPWSPLDWLGDRAMVEGLLARSPSPVLLGGPEVRLAAGKAP